MTKQTAAGKGKEVQGTPRRYKQDPYKAEPAPVELKTRRLQLLLRPSIYDGLKAQADAAGASVNDMANTLLEGALKMGDTLS